MIQQYDLVSPLQSTISRQKNRQLVVRNELFPKWDGHERLVSGECLAHYMQHLSQVLMGNIMLEMVACVKCDLLFASLLILVTMYIAKILLP